MYIRSRKKIRVITGHTIATVTRRYAIDSGCVKFGTTPGGGGAAPTMPTVEFIVWGAADDADSTRW